MTSNISVTSSVVSAVVPTFILLNLTGLTAFHGFEATLLVSGVVAAMAFLVQGARKVSDTIYHGLVSV